MKYTYIGQVSSCWDNFLPAVAVEYPTIRTENISGNAAQLSTTTPDEFLFWARDYATISMMLADPDYDVSYSEKIEEEPI